MGAGKYINILDRNLKTAARSMNLENFTFKQYNDLKHTFKVSKKYCHTHSRVTVRILGNFVLFQTQQNTRFLSNMTGRRRTGPGTRKGYLRGAYSHNIMRHEKFKSHRAYEHNGRTTILGLNSNKQDSFKVSLYNFLLHTGRVPRRHDNTYSKKFKCFDIDTSIA